MNLNQFPLSRNKFQGSVQHQHTKAETPHDDSHNISYGIITAVNPDSSQVKVKLYISDNQLDDQEILQGAFLPLLNPLNQIQHEWGALRVGLIVRVHWKGKVDPKNAVVEVVADEETSFLTKEPVENELPTGPFRIFAGGIL